MMLGINARLSLVVMLLALWSRSDRQYAIVNEVFVLEVYGILWN